MPRIIIEKRWYHWRPRWYPLKAEDYKPEVSVDMPSVVGMVHKLVDEMALLRTSLTPKTPGPERNPSTAFGHSKDVKSNPWVFDATTQGEGAYCVTDGVSGVIFDCGFFIRRMKIRTGDADSAVQIKNRKTSGIDLYYQAQAELVANDIIEVPMGIRTRGIYIQSLPTSAEVYVYHGEK